MLRLIHPILCHGNSGVGEAVISTELAIRLQLVQMRVIVS